jgi:ubiquinone/menaquinone biosynthesis C-methylase UbiE
VSFAAGLPVHDAGRAFDQIAGSYDEIFTRTLVGRAQRDAVWQAMRSAFRAGERILELNCGTGEDAFFLARLGVSVVACDASARMIETAQRRQSAEANQGSRILFRRLQTEELRCIPATEKFDGVLSNFAGLNCVRDLKSVAAQLARLTKPGANAVLCVSTRFCVWETVWFGLRASFRKAFRRIRGTAIARVAGDRVQVWYPTVRSIARSFSPEFRLRSIRAVGLTVPPTYVRAKWINNPAAISFLQRLDARIGSAPLLRVLGDHVLLRFERLPI